jgi:hypothetical protein
MKTKKLEQGVQTNLESHLSKSKVIEYLKLISPRELDELTYDLVENEILQKMISNLEEDDVSIICHEIGIVSYVSLRNFFYCLIKEVFEENSFELESPIGIELFEEFESHFENLNKEELRLIYNQIIQHSDIHQMTFTENVICFNSNIYPQIRLCDSINVEPKIIQDILIKNYLELKNTKLITEFS